MIVTGALALAGLGAVHGVNPGRGWLFAVALGLQSGRGGGPGGGRGPPGGGGFRRWRRGTPSPSVPR